MSKNIFSPKISNQATDSDSIKDFLQNSAKTILAVTFVLLPIFFIPNLAVPLNFTKSFFVIIAVLLTIILLSLSVLRSGKVKVAFPVALSVFWVFSLVALASALLSGDKNDAIYGNILEVHTAGFLILMALIMTSAMAFGGAKTAILRLLAGLGISAFILQLYHLLRLTFGAEFLSFGIFTSDSSSLIGSLNDLALFSGLVVVITLVVIQQIRVSLWSKITAGLLVTSSLILLMAINFLAVWIVVGFFALLSLLYMLAKDTWLRGAKTSQLPLSKTALALVSVVVVFSAAFVISGDYLGGVVSKVTNVSHLEVRPSVSATIDIVRSVYSEDVLLGVGPNRFEDAWRLYKDPVINETIFWNTNFHAGSGFVPTTFVTTGIAGGGMLVLFVLVLLYTGHRLLLLARSYDEVWYFFGTVTIVSAIYLWLMSFIYVPGTVVMLVTALMTGLLLAVYNSVRTNTKFTIDILMGRQYGLVLIAAVLLVVVSSAGAFFKISKNYLAQVTYAKALTELQSGSSVAEFDVKLAEAQDLYEQDVFVAERARTRLVELNTINTIAEPTEADREKFETAMVDGIRLADRAVRLDPSNPFNYLLLASFYNFLSPQQFESVKADREDLISKAHKLDPTNPEVYVLTAQLSARFGDLTKARDNLLKAIKLKGNYTDALFLLTQVDIQEGNVEAAIESTLSIISIEPRNPTRYFQLGVLLSTMEDVKGAIEAFEAAVILDNDYANARYFLALAYLDDGRPEDALAQLRVVEQTNQENAELKNLITQIEGGEFEKTALGLDASLNDEEVVREQDDVVTTSESPDTDLVTPVNQIRSLEPEEELPEVPADTTLEGAIDESNTEEAVTPEETE